MDIEVSPKKTTQKRLKNGRAMIGNKQAQRQKVDISGWRPVLSDKNGNLRTPQENPPAKMGILNTVLPATYNREK